MSQRDLLPDRSARRLSDKQRDMLRALRTAGATGEPLGFSRTGDAMRNQTTVRAMVEGGLLTSSHVGRTLRSLEDRGLVGSRTTLLNQEWGDWRQWWLTPQGNAAVDERQAS